MSDCVGHLSAGILWSRFFSNWITRASWFVTGGDMGIALEAMSNEGVVELAPQVPKRLLVASGKGGSGKTTTCRNLAVAAVLAGLSVTTVDLDESPTLTAWWKRRPEILPAFDHIPAPINEFEGDLRAEIEAVTGCDLLIVDTPPSLSAYPSHARELIRAADLVLVPTQQYDEDLEAVSAWSELAVDLGARALVLLNRTQRRETSFEAAKRRLVKLNRLCPIDIPHYADVPKSFSKGLGVAEVRGAKGGADYEAVLDHIRRELEI